MSKLFINIWDYDDKRYPYQFFVGGRGDGKTYSALDGCIQHWLDGGERFIWMRRTDKELRGISDSRLRGEGANCFGSINSDKGWHYGFVPMGDGLSNICERELKDGRYVPIGDSVGTGVALSTVCSIRGMDLTNHETIVYDEFIPEKHVRKFAAEGEAFLQAMETIQRNRELKGGRPMRVFCLANAFNIYNDIFVELGIVNIIERCINRGQYDYYDESRGLAVHLLKSSQEFVDKKKATALYKLAGNTRFTQMALENDFVYNDFSLVGYRNIKGYRPVCSIGNAYIWEKKGDLQYYVTYCAGKCVHYNDKLLHDRKAFLLNFGSDFMSDFIQGRVWFETYALKEQMIDILKIK